MQEREKQLVLCSKLQRQAPKSKVEEEEMAESEVKSAAQWLGKVMGEEIKYLGGVRGKVEILRTELNTLAAFLTDAALRSRRQNNVVRTTLIEARNIACDCEDVIERYILQVARHGYEEYEGCHPGSVMRWGRLLRKAIHVHKIHSKIDELNGRLTVLKSCLISYGVSDRIIADEINPAPLRQVGLDNHLADLVHRLLNPTDHTVIAVYGMGGIGKSMLARELFEKDTLRGSGGFKAFGWASASQQFKLKTVLQDLLYSLVPENDHVQRSRIEAAIQAGCVQAVQVLCSLMSRVKCLVVIDDIWTSDDWAKLGSAFPVDGASESRILLTSRKGDILSGLDPNQVYLHRMEGLDEAKSWELLEKTTFPGATCTDSTKKELGQEMLRHCKGVPLAIVVLAKVLKRKGSVDDWIQMRNDISAKIRRGGAPNLYKEVYDVLLVSYDELPYHLKHCFLHLANFPEDHKIPTQKLYQLWVGEGIVSTEDEDELEEDIAERYLNDLVSRSMIQVDSLVKGSERIDTCRLHDLMRDICMEIAKTEGFHQIVNCQGPMLLNADRRILMTSLPEVNKRLRRIAVYVSDDQEPQSPTLPTNVITTTAKVSRAPNLRSLLLFFINYGLQQGEENWIKFVETICNDFPLLRVMDYENFGIEGKLPKKVGNLIHLRYLGLANTHVSKLPSSIEKIQWLQTLDLRVHHDVVFSLPNILWKMKQLRHLYLPYYGALGLKEQARNKAAMQRYLIEGGGALQLDGLRKLQTLMNIDLDRVDLNNLSMMLKMLKTLSAACATNKDALSNFLRYSSGMKSCTLKLHARILNLEPTILSSCKAMCDMDIHSEPNIYCRLTRPLRLEMLPQGLVRLGIWYLHLVNDPLPVLERLPNLVQMFLHMCYHGEKMVCSTGGFPQLIDATFDGLFKFRHWEVEQGALQKLKNVRIYNCLVERIPDALPSSVTVIFPQRPEDWIKS